LVDYTRTRQLTQTNRASAGAVDLQNTFFSVDNSVQGSPAIAEMTFQGHSRWSHTI